MTTNLCFKKNCYETVVAQGLCNRHYIQAKKSGEIETIRPRRILIPELIEYENDTYGIQLK